MATAVTAETEFATVAEIAARLRVSEPTIYRRVHAGEIPAVRVGDDDGLIRIPVLEFERWLFRENASGASPVTRSDDPVERSRPA